jgi:hypothetical protein
VAQQHATIEAHVAPAHEAIPCQHPGHHYSAMWGLQHWLAGIQFELQHACTQ